MFEIKNNITGIRSSLRRWHVSAVIYITVWPVAGQICSLSHTGQHAPQGNTQVNTDKPSLVDLSRLVSLAKSAKYSLSVHICPSLSSPPLPLDLHRWVHIVLLSESHSFLSHQSLCLFAPWEEEDVPSCCAQLCLSEVAVCVCGHESDRGSKTPLQSRCPSICADHSLLFPPLPLSVTHIHTFTQRLLLQDSVTLLSENEKMWKYVKAKERGAEWRVEGWY